MVRSSDGITLLEPQVGHFPAQSVEKDMTKMQRPSPSGKFLGVQEDGVYQDILSTMKDNHFISFILSQNKRHNT